MSQLRRAVIDVGTNSVKLLVADVTGRDVRPVLEDSKQTRLGRGFYETHRLQPETIEKTALTVAKFAATASELNAQSIRVIATSAARDAVNPDDLTSAIQKASGLTVEIISGEQEADWAFQGVTTDPELAKLPLLLLDVGGGSTEFILGHGTQKDFRQSFSLGTVRLLEKFPHGDPPTSDELAACRAWLKVFLQGQVRPAIEPAMRRERKLDPKHREVRLVGTGGTTSILARMEMKMEGFDRERIEAVRLSLPDVRRHMERLWQLPLEERRKTVGLPPKRADVILMGVAIFEAVMEEFEFDELRVSTRGLRYAALME
jgi:exopolyphosphatase / guanosine-5'-triphosphate,3'-diphosphate pyrophosphatase